MDADTLGLATALSVLGIYGLADLVEMARANTLNEMILSAVELHDLEQHAAHAVAAANLMPVAVTAYAEVGTATDGCAMQDASTTAAFTPPAAQEKGRSRSRRGEGCGCARDREGGRADHPATGHGEHLERRAVEK